MQSAEGYRYGVERYPCDRECRARPSRRSDLENHVKLDVAVKLLGYGRLLRNIAENNSFDCSVAQAASKWIAESIQGCSRDFLPLVDPARGLKDVVSLSSGLGITEIWSTLSVHRPICASLTDLRSLETIARDIDSTCDVHGPRMQIFQVMALRTLSTSPTDDERRNLAELSE